MRALYKTRRDFHLEETPCTYVLLVLISLHRSKRRKTVFVHPCVSLINRILVTRSFTILHRLAQICYTRVILESRDSRKWIIASLKWLVYGKVGFQKLTAKITLYRKSTSNSGNRLDISQLPDISTPPIFEESQHVCAHIRVLYKNHRFYNKYVISHVMSHRF